MILFPAIDLMEGRSVRLLRGAKDRATVYDPTPAQTVAMFEDSGCQWLHVVDLDGAFSGDSENAQAISEILDAVSIPIQLGGGIRDLATVEYWIEAGVSRIIFGTAAVESPELVEESCRRFQDRIAIGIDARNGMVATRGWIRQTEVTAVDLAKRFEDLGVSAIIYTDIQKDGAMEGPNTDATVAIANSVSTPVIASGGISTLGDLESLKACDAILEGVIVGRAIHEGVIKPADALRVLGAPTC